MKKIIIIHAFKQEARNWEKLLKARQPQWSVTVALTMDALEKAIEEGADTWILDVSAAAWLGHRLDVLLRDLAQLPPVILTAEKSEALLSFATFSVAVRLSWQEAQHSLPKWVQLTTQLHAAITGIHKQPSAVNATSASLLHSHPDALKWERWLPWLSEYFDPATHFARETLFLEALLDLAAHAQREEQNLTVIACALDDWEKHLQHWHPHETISIRKQVARLMVTHTAPLSPYLAAPEPELFWLAMVGISAEDALVIAENLRQLIPQQLPMAMSASLGVATFPITERRDSGHEVLGAAMKALREARSKGTAQIRVALACPTHTKSA